MSRPDPAPPAVLAQTITESEAETTALAAKLAQAAAPGDLILLSGDLGAGKTAFARGFIQALLQETGVLEDVPSPTFTLVQTYETARGAVWHADLYRLEEAAELDEVGLLDAGSDTITLVEWAERVGDIWPDHAVRLAITQLGPTRRAFSLTRVDGSAVSHPFATAMAAA